MARLITETISAIRQAPKKFAHELSVSHPITKATFGLYAFAMLNLGKDILTGGIVSPFWGIFALGTLPLIGIARMTLDGTKQQNDK